MPTNKLSKIFSYITLVSLLAGCTNVGIFIANAPTYFANLHIVNDVSYGDNSEQKLDIYSASDIEKNKSLPVIIFFYGGRWTFGQKEQYRFVAERLAKEGYMVVIPDYAKYPKVKFPELMEDPARSVAWVIENIPSYGGDKSQIFLMGHSAGAFISAMLISDEKYLKKYTISPKSITAFAGLAGPYSFTPDEPDLKDIFSTPDKYPQMQVPNFINGDEPPMLLLSGNEDEAVNVSNLIKLETSIKEQGGVVKSKVYNKLGHIGIIASFAKAYVYDYPVPEDCINFFAKYVKQ